MAGMETINEPEEGDPEDLQRQLLSMKFCFNASSNFQRQFQRRWEQFQRQWEQFQRQWQKFQRQWQIPTPISTPASFGIGIPVSTPIVAVSTPSASNANGTEILTPMAETPPQGVPLGKQTKVSLGFAIAAPLLKSMFFIGTASDILEQKLHFQSGAAKAGALEKVRFP